VRYLLPAVAVAVALLAASDPAPAKSSPHPRPMRAKSHVSLHLSGHNVLRGRDVVLRGRVRPGGGRRVKVIVRGPGWFKVALFSKASGAFSIRWRPSQNGTYRVRAYGIHDRHVKGAASVVRRVTAYRPAVASYYGPGLYGNGVACGGTLLPGTLGVAHRSLPCGAKVKLRYRGRSITVPVIDRGPYVAGRDFDLTEATKVRLGFPGVDVLLASR
jgi:rare lipoprotein A